MKKQGGKTGDSIDKKPLKLNEETRKKIDHLFVKVEIVCKRWKTSKI